MTSLRERFMPDMKDAMKAGEKEKVAAIRLIVAALKETLRTMSADLVLDACLRIPVIGSGADPDRIADIPRFAVPISAALRALIAHVERTAGARPTAE